MSSWSFRAVAAVLALGATLIVFWLWITFGAELHNAMGVMSVKWADPNKPPDNGEISVNVLPAPTPQPVNCPKGKSRHASCP